MIKSESSWCIRAADQNIHYSRTQRTCMNVKEDLKKDRPLTGICSKILKTSCLPKGPKQTVQIQIRLLLKQSDLGIPCLHF